MENYLYPSRSLGKDAHWLNLYYKNKNAIEVWKSLLQLEKLSEKKKF